MSVANAYAKALFEVAAEAKSTTQDFDRLEAEMDNLLELIAGHKELKIVLFSPLAGAREKIAVLTQLCTRIETHKFLVDFVKLLARKGRLPILKEIREAFRSIRLGAEGGMAGKVISAEAMTELDIEDLAKAFGKKLGKRVAFRVSVDPTLLAGVRVNINGVTYDGTLRSQLERLRDRLSDQMTAGLN